MTVSILNSNNDSNTDYSKFCPACGGVQIRKGTLGGQDFDEKGWWQSQELICENPKCNHTWYERLVLIPGNQGHLFHHG